jgi:isocitrate dehydrogenase
MLSSRFLARAAARPLLSSSTHVRVANTISTAPLSTGVDGKMKAPKMVYISGEEMTNYCMNLILEKWIQPHFDTSAWEFYDLSCTGRDNSDDKVLHDAVDAGKRIGAIFKEPTVTPSATQVKEMGLKKQWGSPNGAMRRGWNGITISRDTIHIDGMELGFKKPVLFERQAVGGEYAAGHKMVGAGDVKTIFYPKDGSESQIVDQRVLDGSKNAVVTYDNPYNGVEDLAHHFFTRCLKVGVTPYVVTKKTVFKWQEMFWVEMKQVFDEHYATKFKEAGLLDKCGGDLQHLISDAATMQIIRWTDGGFGMAAHNYDGDMLTDEVVSPACVALWGLYNVDLCLCVCMCVYIHIYINACVHQYVSFFFIFLFKMNFGAKHRVCN